MGNARIDAAASRLNEAFIKLTRKMEHLQSQVSENPEIDLLEQENMRLHQENAELRQLLEETDQKLAEMAEHLEYLLIDEDEEEAAA